MRQRTVQVATLALCWLSFHGSGDRLSAATSAPEAQAVRLSRLQGSASLGRNRQVTGATILVQGVDSGASIFVTASDHRGLFSVDGLPDGQYRVELRRDGLESVVKEDIELRFPARPVVEVLMKPRTGAQPVPSRESGAAQADAVVRLSGRVAIRDGGALAGAELCLRRPDGSRDPLRVHSGEDGRFVLPALAAGEWQLEARAAGFLPIRTELRLAEDALLDLSLVTQGADYKPSPHELMPREQVVPPGS